MDACEADLKRTRKELHSQERLKYKLGTELDNLDVLAEDYDDEYEAVQLKIDEVYDRNRDSEEKDPEAEKADGGLCQWELKAPTDRSRMSALQKCNCTYRCYML